jgi:hypothetical protein
VEEELQVLFVTLLAPKGKGKAAVGYLRTLEAPRGITVRDVYFTFGRYDGVIVFEAPDMKTAIKNSDFSLFFLFFGANL